MKKYTVLSMDVEDWYHLDYFDKNNCDQSQTTLDGLDVFLKILDEYNVRATFFVVGELIPSLVEEINLIASKGHEIALHSYSHKRPLLMNIDEFKEDTEKAITT